MFESRTIVLILSTQLSIYAVCSAKRLPKVFGILIYDDITTLDIMGPLAYFNNLPDVRIHLIHDSMKPTPSGNVTSFLHELYAGQFYQPSYSMETAPPLDVLVIPGGFTGTAAAINDVRWERYIKKVFPTLQYLFSVCTGSGFVAKSGVLDGRRATTNKAAFKWIETFGPKVRWIPEARWVVDGKIWTSSGKLP